MEKPKLDRRSRSILYFLGIVALSVIGLILEYYQNGLALEATQDPSPLSHLVVVVNAVVVFFFGVEIIGNFDFTNDKDAAPALFVLLMLWMIVFLLVPIKEYAIALQMVIGIALFLMGFSEKLNHGLVPATRFLVSGIFGVVAFALVVTLIGSFAYLFLFTLVDLLLLPFVRDIVTTLEAYRMGNLDVRGRLVWLAFILGLLPPLAMELVIYFRNAFNSTSEEFNIRNFFPVAQWRKRFLVACGVGVLVFVVSLMVFFISGATF